MRQLSFIGDCGHSKIHNLLTCDMSVIPQKPGAYILLADLGTTFLYPKGSSPVFYIGQATNLRRRLMEHRMYSLQAKSGKDRKLSLYYPRYEYAAAFGCRVVFIPTLPRMTPRRLEDVLLSKFAKCYYSWPVANSAGSWVRVE